MRNFSFRTDMADERVDTYKQVNNLTEIDGIKVESKTDDMLTITTVDVLNENGKNAVKKDIGKYLSVIYLVVCLLFLNSVTAPTIKFAIW